MFGYVKLTPLEKEWQELKRKEKALEKKAGRETRGKWREELEKKVPEKVLSGLQAAFSKGFALLFSRGTKILEKTYDPETLRQKHAVSDGKIVSGTDRKELRKARMDSTGAQLGNLAVTTAEGIGLGALGVGMPDIVIFLGMLLKGIYETALRYGYEYDTPGERLLILKMMETSLSKGGDWHRCNAEVECLMAVPAAPDGAVLEEQTRKTGEMFAVDMLLAKFIQGMPVVGMLGGAANPVYYNKVMQYVELKYRKRYLRDVAKRKGICLK